MQLADCGEPLAYDTAFWLLGFEDESGFEIAANTTEEWFGRFIKSEIAKWAGVIEKAGIKAE